MGKNKGNGSKCKSENHKTEDDVSRGENESIISPQDKMEQSNFSYNRIQN